MRATGKGEEAYKLLQIAGEFTTALDKLQQVQKAVVLYGSARTPSSNDYFLKAYRVAQAFAEEGFHVVSGGGTGIMTAANMGALRQKKSVGLNIALPFEQAKNPYQT